MSQRLYMNLDYIGQDAGRKKLKELRPYFKEVKTLNAGNKKAAKLLLLTAFVFIYTTFSMIISRIKTGVKSTRKFYL